MSRLLLPALLVAVLVAGIGLVWRLRAPATPPSSGVVAQPDASVLANQRFDLDRRIPVPDASAGTRAHDGDDDAPPSNPRVRNPERERDVRERTEAVLAANAGKSGAILQKLECLADQCVVEIIVDDMAEFGRAYEALQSPGGYPDVAKTMVLMNPIPGPDGRTIVPFALNFYD